MIARRNTGLAVLAASAVLVLTGCGSLHPGVAAVVGSDTITHDEVDRVAAAICSANTGGAAAQGQPPPALATSGVRQSALQVLLESESSRLFGEEEGVEPDKQKLSQALAQNESAIAALPEDQRGDFRDAIENYATGQLILIEIGRASLEEQGSPEAQSAGGITDDVALSEGMRLRSDFLTAIDVEVDPRYGSFEDEILKPGGAALSVPTSENARAAITAEPPGPYVESLPASQRCS